MKNQKGITLIALVITIIVLLILAGVSIAMLTGQNGLLTKANQSNEKTQEAEVRENVEIAISAAYTNKLKADPTNTSITLTGIEVAKEVANTNNVSADSTTGVSTVITAVSSQTLTYAVSSTVSYTVVLANDGLSITSITKVAS